MIILSKFDEDWTKMWPLECSQGFFHDLTYWPSYWPNVTHIRTSPRYCQDDHSEQVWWRLDQKLWPLECSQGFSMIWPTDLVSDPKSPIFELDWDIIKMIILSKFDKIGPKLWPLGCSQCFSMIWPTDLVFDPTSPIFELNWDIVKMMILSKFDEVCTKNVASRVFTRFFHDLTYWPCFWPDMTHIRTWPRYCQDNHSEQVWWWLGQTVASRMFTRFFNYLTYWPCFWPDMTYIRTWPRYCQDDHSEQVRWWLDQNCGPLWCSQGFSLSWPTDLVFWPHMTHIRT